MLVNKVINNQKLTIIYLESPISDEDDYESEEDEDEGESESGYDSDLSPSGDYNSKSSLSNYAIQDDMRGKQRFI
jgi:hypothetical protein